MRARVCKAAQGLATVVAIATAFAFSARAADYTILDSAAALALGGATGGDEIRKIWNLDGTFDLVHIFTNTASAQTFSVPAVNKISNNLFRVLLVAGGGSGGATMAGGGGGGGVLDLDAVEISSGGSATVTVGAGAAPRTPTGTGSNSNTQPGGNRGGNSIFAIAGGTTTTAYGGSGGKGWAQDGQGSSPYGSTGGGSGARTGAMTGYTAGQGYSGGSGLNGNSSQGAAGGGGGGAGGAGSAGSRTSNNATGGKGGDGIASDITGETLYYGAGGGGGASYGASSWAMATGGAGGKSGDGTGNWGRGANRYVTPGTTTSGVGKPVAGQDGFGGGGGGGTYTYNNPAAGNLEGMGAKGGSGIVVIRYTVIPYETVSGEKVYTFTDPAAAMDLVLGKASLVRVLAVGGGGAGANPGTSAIGRGGAGGGGAGGMLETTNVWPIGTYRISVGAGGLTNAVTGTRAVGMSGGGSAVTNATTSAEMIAVVGGGGGGIWSVGSDGGSGGGGSASYSGGIVSQNGGSGIDGQGYAGGRGRYAGGGGGGGGAGGAGSENSAVSSNVSSGGAGGAPRPSDITGPVKWYAAGGGGGSFGNHATAVSVGGAGGQDGDGIELGGHGGYGTSSSKTVATGGVDGTGSGGGGGCYNSPGGKGGDGIVVIRVIRGMPDAPTKTDYEFTYDGTEHWVFGDEADSAIYTITETTGGASSPVTRIAKTARGTYTFTVALKGGYCWADGTTAGYDITLTISKAAVSITSFSQAGWQIGEWKDPVIATVPESGLTVRYEYSDNGVSDWSTTLNETAGTHYIRAVIDSTDDYTGATSAVRSFSLWEYAEPDWGGIDWLGYHAELTVSTAATETLTNFPMVVRLSEAAIAGFQYSQAWADGGDLRFFDENGTMLAYEIESWDAAGESILWVKVPEYYNGAKVDLYWGELEGADLAEHPTPPATKVWSEYAGVWHFGEVADGTPAIDTADSSGNSGNGTVGTGVATNGLFGAAIGSSSKTAAMMKVPSSTAMDDLTNGTFRVGFWVWMDSNVVHWPYFFGRNTDQNNVGWSARIAGTSLAASGTPVRMTWTNSGGQFAAPSVPGLVPGEWIRLDFVWKVGRVEVWTNGVFAVAQEGAGNRAVNANNQLAIGGWIGGGFSADVGLLGCLEEFRLMGGEIDNAWVWAEYEQAGAAYTVSAALTTTNGVFVNRWITSPGLDKTEWDAGTPGATVTLGTTVYGRGYYVFTDSWHGVSYTNEVPTAAGTYTVTFVVDAGQNGTKRWGESVIDGGMVVINPIVDGSTAIDDATRMGRVLLVNDDANASGAISGQSYYLTNDTTAVYWVHEGDSAVTGMPYMEHGTNSTLVATNAVDALCGATTIWTLDNVRIGNTYPTALTEASTKNFLPWSPTGKATFDSTVATLGRQQDSANLLMRNVKDAAIYSPCYTNGIGTLYFDAVNGWTSADGAEYQLVVEWATNAVTGAGESVLPTDAHLAAGSINAWHEVKNLHPLRVSGAGATALDATNVLALAVSTGGGHSDFYRVYAPINYYAPCRFRIRRASINSTYSDNPDNNAFILVDNIIVSYPPVKVNLTPKGRFDKDRNGKLTIGWGGAFSPAFPSVGDKITARAESHIDGVTTNRADELVTAATLRYRWHYLQQTNEAWQAVSLNSGFEAVAPLVLPGMAGDVDFRFELTQVAPYYSYLDYTGTGAGLGDSGYSERVAAVTSTLANTDRDWTTNDTYKVSAGTDWFVRLRDGASELEGVWLELKTTDDDELPPVGMELKGDHLWRGYYRTPTNSAVKGVYYRLREVNRQTDGSAAYAFNTNYLWSVATTSALPVSTALASGSEEEAEWSTAAVPVDAATGYLLFQMDDSLESLTIVHADYQSFNAWNDAKSATELFVGSATFASTNGTMSGVSSDAKEFDTKDHWPWADSVSTNDSYWAEHFHRYSDTDYEMYKTYASITTPNGWSAAQGRYVFQSYRGYAGSEGSIGDQALQLMGQGLGSIYYVGTNVATRLRGLESVSFKARLAQTATMDDYCWYGNGLSLTNYTASTPVRMTAEGVDNFTGAGSVSLAAYYTPHKGCYELRCVRTATNAVELCLYKWYYKSGKLVEQKLGGVNHGSGLTASGLMGKSGDSTAYARMTLSVTNGTDGVRVIGLLSAADATTYADSDTLVGSKKSFAVSFLDTGTRYGAALTKGTFGVMSLNCPARFVKPRYFTEPLPFNYTGGGAAKTTDDFTEYPSSYEQALPNTTTAVPCLATESAVENWWVDPSWFNPELLVSGTSYYALTAAVPTQTVEVYTAKDGGTQWGNTPVVTKTISGFGSGAAEEIPLYKTENAVSVKIAAGGTLDDTKVDIVVDDLVLKQWAGEDSVTANYTNWTFQSGWVADGKLTLSAKRTPVGSDCAVYAPLMDGQYAGGTGLGMLAFEYAAATTNVELVVEVATNVNRLSLSAAMWQTVTNYTFAAGESGLKSLYFGYHGTRAWARIRLSANTLAQVRSVTAQSDYDAFTNKTAFGEITLTRLFCRDEPDLDARSWWGWNLRSVGQDLDKDGRMFLGDWSTDAGRAGLSLALNNSWMNNTKATKAETDARLFAQHMPFVQTPYFDVPLVGEISFKARTYDNPPGATFPRVILYGATTNAEEDAIWTPLGEPFVVSNTLYAAYSYRDPDNVYNAFRLAVAGVEDLDSYMNLGYEDAEGNPWPAAARVLFDEIVVSEAVYPKMGFTFVGPFRNADAMNDESFVPNVPSKDEHPMFGESWGVECQVTALQLENEIDFDRGVRVKLHWFNDVTPWGFSNWTNKTVNGTTRGEAWLAEVPGTNGVFRSGYLIAPDAVIPEMSRPSTVQYMLEIHYYQKSDKGGASVERVNYLEPGVGGWTKPAWYNPIDYNAELGKNSKTAFSAYCILETVPFGWAWINEVNLLGYPTNYFLRYENEDENCQYVEIAAPDTADLTDWSVVMYESPQNSGRVVTNRIATFGYNGLTNLKVPTTYDPAATSNMVFYVLASPDTATGGRLSAANDELDGTWSFVTNTETFATSGAITPYSPVGIQLVRPSGIVEHEVVVRGLDLYYDAPTYSEKYSPTNTVNALNRLMPGAAFFFAGDDDAGSTNYFATAEETGNESLGVFADKGEHAAAWTNVWTKTPGKINVNQTIPGVPPGANGSSMVVRSIVEGDYIWQPDSNGEGWTNVTRTLMITKGRATNLVYKVGRWYEVAYVTTNDVATTMTAAEPQADDSTIYTYTIDESMSNDVRVVVASQPETRLMDTYGLRQSAYRDGILNWLVRGKSAYGEAWPGGTDLFLAKFRSLHGTVEEDMTLETMYWLDICPTVSNLVLVGGLAASSVLSRQDAAINGGAPFNNMKVCPKLYITNENETVTWSPKGDGAAVWAPYCLRGKAGTEAPESWAYAYGVAAPSWSNAVFKIAGIESLTLNLRNRNNWVDERYFIFEPNSFDADFTSKIEVWGASVPLSQAYWVWTNPSGGYYWWSLEDDVRPRTIEVLKQENMYYDD